MQQFTPKPDLEAPVDSDVCGVKVGSTCRILFALTTQDREQFFPKGIRDEGLASEVHIAADWELSQEHWPKLLQDFEPDIIITGWSTPRISEDIMKCAWFQPQYICHLGGSVRSILPVELIDRGVLVSNWGRLAATSVAEHAVLLALACARNLPLWRPVLEAGESGHANRIATIRTRTLSGKRVGIHGFGSVAREVARLLHPFDVSTSVFSESVPAAKVEKYGLHGAKSLEVLFAESNILIECEALTDSTRGSVTADLLKSLPDDAIFVNVGRGALVDENALARLAKSGRLRVATDVTIQEPLPLDSPLGSIPTILCSPHIAGPTEDLYEKCGYFALENIRRYLNQEPIEALVGREIYTRST